MFKRLIRSKYQTKNWRKEQNWYANGKHNECEKYQINILEKITEQSINKTILRLNISSLLLNPISNPLSKKSGFEWTENFDGMQISNNKIIYYNLKFVCDRGGAQTRTLRETYLFIKTQLEYLKYHPDDENIIFINILDGDESFRRMRNFNYLHNKDVYNDIKKKVYIGSTYDFYHWWKSWKSNNLLFDKPN